MRELSRLEYSSSEDKNNIVLGQSAVYRITIFELDLRLGLGIELGLTLGLG